MRTVLLAASHRSGTARLQGGVLRVRVKVEAHARAKLLDRLAVGLGGHRAGAGRGRLGSRRSGSSGFDHRTGSLGVLTSQPLGRDLGDEATLLEGSVDRSLLGGL